MKRSPEFEVISLWLEGAMKSVKNISQNSLPSCQSSNRVPSWTQDQHKTEDHSNPIEGNGVARFYCQEQELKSTFWEQNMAERSYWKESVAKRRMITDTAWAKIYWYAREGYIDMLEKDILGIVMDRGVKYRQRTLADSAANQTGLFISVNILICAD